MYPSILTYRDIKNDNNLKVVTIRILTFLSGCILALLKALCSPLKKVLDVNIRNLLLKMRLQCTWSKEIACNVLAT